MFSRRWIINYVLIVLIVLFTYVGNKYDVQTGEQKSDRITTFSADDIDRLEVQTGGARMELRREAGGWRLESPIRWPANEFNVERLLEIINARTESKIAAADVDPDAFGLQFPRAIMHLGETRVVFGITSNIGERRYTMIDETVYLLPDVYYPFITQGLPGLVDRRLLPKAIALQSLRLPELEIIRGSDNGWRANGGGIGGEQTELLVGNWQSLEAARIKPYDAAATPRQKIMARLEDGDSLEFFLMSIEPEIVIAHPQLGLQYHFSHDYYYQLVSLRRNEVSG